MAVTDYVYDHWGNVTEIDCLYEELESKFYLIMEDEPDGIEIVEPVGWDQVQIVCKRSKDYHGFTYEFMGEEVELQFDEAAGGDIIRDEYDAKGNDGDIVFRKVVVYSGTEIIEYEGQLNLNTLKRDDRIESCVIERKSLHQKINSRMDTILRFDDLTDLDGGDIDIEDKKSALYLPSREISETFISKKDIMEEADYTEGNTRNQFVALFFNISNPDVDNIKEFNGNILGFTTNDEMLKDNTLFLFKANGTYNFNFTIDHITRVSIKPAFLNGSVDIDVIHCRHYFVHYRGDTIINKYMMAPPYMGTPGVRNVTLPRMNFTYSQEIEVERGDTVTMYCEIHFIHGGTKLKSIEYATKNYKTNLTVEGTSIAPVSAAAGILIKEATEIALQKITGQDNILRTSFYSRAGGEQLIDGCGANRMLLSGWQLRKGIFYTASFQMSFSLKNLLSSMDSIDCIGMGYEWDSEAEKEVMRIEPAEYFYQDEEIIELEDIGDYKIETAKDLIYNQIEIGYEKYNEDAVNSLDEAHAYHEYQTPIVTEVNKYTKKSKFIASSYLLETTRREVFEIQEKQATKHDDDIFVVHVKYSPPTDEFPLWIYRPVHEEPFSDISGILSPSTATNLTLTPKRMLFAHGKWLMSSLVYKGGSDIIRNTFTKQNKDLTTTLDSDYPCERGDTQKLPLKESDHVILSAFGDGLGIYSPEWVEFTTRLPKQEVRYIINCLRGLNEEGKNYGYISFTDDRGIKRKGWLYEMKFSPVSEEVTMRLLKKKFP